MEKNQLCNLLPKSYYIIFNIHIFEKKVTLTVPYFVDSTYFNKKIFYIIKCRFYCFCIEVKYTELKVACRLENRLAQFHVEHLLLFSMINVIFFAQRNEVNYLSIIQLICAE